MKPTILSNHDITLNLLSTLIIVFLMSGCGFPPINSTFESARTLGKGNIEVSGNYSKYIIQSEAYHSSLINIEEKSLEFNNYGFRLGFGITDNADIKIRYQRTIRDGEGIDYIELNPKFSTFKNKYSYSMPLGIYLIKQNHLFVISPKFICTQSTSDKFDLSYSLKADIFPSNLKSILLGLNLGAGFSSNLNQWAIRPEIGIMINLLQFKPIWTYGIGFNYIISK